MHTQMTLQDAVELYTALEQESIRIWIDGGWGVDALLAKQTRDHKDLDIVVEQRDVHGLRVFLYSRGYKDMERPDTSSWNFVLGDDMGHEVDVHMIVFDDAGNGLYGEPKKGIMYPAVSLTGIGRIGDTEVRCISAEWLVKFHSGYPLQPKDFQDVTALCEKFGIPLPEEYKMR